MRGVDVKQLYSSDTSYLAFTYDATNFTQSHEYDYIIVGGGTAGCPLAATLSQNYSVLVLERGDVPDADPNALFETSTAINVITANEHNSIAQSFTSEDGIPNNRGNILGGSSMVNYGYYTRGDEYFYNKSGIPWDMENVIKAYEWVEDSIVTKHEHLNTWQNSTLNALLESGVGPANGFTVEHLIGTKVTGSTFDGSGIRHGAVELLSKANPENLRVVVKAIVDRIIFSSSNSSGVTTSGVVYHDSNGRRHEVRIRKNGEVILSAGAIGSPQLLLLSGVGPSSYLQSQNIPVVLNQPYVGQFMADKQRLGVSLIVPFPLADVGGRVVGITNDNLYIETISSIVPFDSPANPIIFPDPDPPLYLSVVAFCVEVTRPLSVGSLSLKSVNDVTVNPKVRFNYFSKKEDLVQCANAVHAIDKLLRTPTMDLYKFSNKDGSQYFKLVGVPLPGNLSDEDSVYTYCRKTLRTFWHFNGGCLVDKVVDTDLKVVGINGLRIVDSSVLSDSPGTNPQATVMMLGRYIGIKLHNARG
ncbi:sinalpyl alcohol oxidase Nec3-like [Bidens hawaiensis]|uniref:sinalpyl alcohol oxidase Nec3-like n=1 Tax=Bidens hawaiensis TaxID=980011 RepID=UPI00404AE050